MKRVFLFCLLLSVSLVSREATAADLRNSVVKIFTTSNRMDFYHPWQAKGSSANIGSGCIIEGNRILTNAHVVSNHTFIQVKKHFDPKKYTARVIAIGHDCDLAILTVEDEEFFKGMPPLKIGELSQLQDTVNVIGFPRGGDKISVTEGVVSRIEVTTYSHSFRRLLTVQIDAAINPGNSGGPIVQNGKLVGIAMQVAQQTQNIGYIIPTPIIKHFLKDLEDGWYQGFPSLGIEFNTTENSALREYYRLTGKKGGILISSIMPHAPAFGFLQPGDIILALDGIPIAEDGTFEFRGTERLFLSHLITDRQVGESLNLTLVRSGREQNLNIPLKAFDPLVHSPYFYEKPDYYIFGGLVFTVLSSDLMQEWGQQWWQAPLDFNYYRIGAGRFNDGEKEEMVVMLDVLPDDVNVGYHDYSNLIIQKVNGQEFNSFKEFVLLLSKKEGDYTVIETEQKKQMILDNKHVHTADQRILKRNNIPAAYSAGVARWLKNRR